MGNITKKWGHFFYVVVIVAFLFPFVGISCQGVTVLNFSGFQLVGGCEPEMMGGGGMGDMGGGEEKSEADKKLDIDPEPFAAGALILALIGLGVAYVRKGKKTTMLMNAGIAAAGTLCLVLLAIKAKGEEADIAKMSDLPAKGDGPNIDLGVSVNLELGFMLAVLAFVALIVGSVIAYRQWESLAAQADSSAPSGPPPGTAPPGSAAPPAGAPGGAPPGPPPDQAPPGPPPA